MHRLVRFFLTNTPAWVLRLMRWRDCLVKLLGLKTIEIKAPLNTNNPHFSPRSKLGLFGVYKCHDRELIIDVDDKHLNLRVSIYLRVIEVGQKICVSKLVFFRSALGKIYWN